MINTMTSEEKTVFRNEICCILGLLIYTPVRDVWGMQIPCPSLSDLTLAGAVTTNYYIHLAAAYHNTYSGLEKGTGSLCYFLELFKIFGLFMIYYSGDTCIARLNDAEGIYNGLYQLLALFGCGVIYHFFALTRQ